MFYSPTPIQDSNPNTAPKHISFLGWVTDSSADSTNTAPQKLTQEILGGFFHSTFFNEDQALKKMPSIPGLSSPTFLTSVQAVRYRLRRTFKGTFLERGKLAIKNGTAAYRSRILNEKIKRVKFIRKNINTVTFQVVVEYEK